MNLVYDINDKPPVREVILFAIQELLAIMAATIAVPFVVNSWCATNIGEASTLSPAAALFGAGLGTICYLLITKSRSPIFLGSSFTFLGSMYAAFAGAVSISAGYAGIIIGAFIAGLVYVIIALVIKKCGAKWIDKLLPPVVIGPTVAIIGLSLASNAIGDLTNAKGGSVYVALVCGLVTLLTVMLCSAYGKTLMKLIPFFLGILAGYITASIFYVIGDATGNDALKVIDYSAFANMTTFFSLPDFTFLKADWSAALTPGYLITIFVAYAPVGVVVFTEHLSDHKNLSTIIGHDLLNDPGLHRTVMGDGIGTMVGAFFGGACNTTYGESVACVGVTKNASIVSIWGAAIAAILFSLITPLVCFLETIPSCVMGAVCIVLYGFISSSGFKMFQKVDLNKNSNLYTACVIFIVGVGGLTVSFGKVTLTTLACALILGIATNKILANAKD